MTGHSSRGGAAEGSHVLLARRGFSSQSTALSQQARDKSAVSKQDIAEWRWYLPRAPLAERRQGPCGPLPLIPSPRMERRRDKAKRTRTERSPPPPGPCGTGDRSLRVWQDPWVHQGVHPGCRLGQLSVAMHRSHLSGASCHVNPKGTRVQAISVKPGASLIQKPVL